MKLADFLEETKRFRRIMGDWVGKLGTSDPEQVHEIHILLHQLALIELKVTGHDLGHDFPHMRWTRGQMIQHGPVPPTAEEMNPPQHAKRASRPASEQSEEPSGDAADTS